MNTRPVGVSGPTFRRSSPSPGVRADPTHPAPAPSPASTPARPGDRRACPSRCDRQPGLEDSQPSRCRAAAVGTGLDREGSDRRLLRIGTFVPVPVILPVCEGTSVFASRFRSGHSVRTIIATRVTINGWPRARGRWPGSGCPPGRPVWPPGSVGMATPLWTTEIAARYSALVAGRRPGRLGWLAPGRGEVAQESGHGQLGG